jgi:ubiquitin-conjugating enzyme E2 D
LKNLSSGEFENLELVFEELTLWKVTIIGPQDTPYEGGKFVVFIDFIDHYPWKPPRIYFQTRIYHPMLVN